MSDTETTSILIVGCGPTGALLSVLLSKLQVPSICLDKEPDIVTDPRGIALDEDGIRALQAAGIYEHIHSKMGQCTGIFNFVSGTHSDLRTPPFMRMDLSTSEGGTGHVGFIFQKQPVMEHYLRQNIPDGSLRTGCTITGIEEIDEDVVATYVDANGREKKVKAKFLVGADGKTGYTRKKYLEPKGVLMEATSKGGDYAETWVAMNLKLALPTPETHPNFPLWDLGHTPEQVYDEFFPEDFRFLCNPKRPSVCGRFGMPEDRLWRFEYVVQEGEDGNDMASYEKIRKIVFPYLRHSGRRYGLSEDVSYPEDCIEVLRSRPFFFSARSCNQWALGRVILCGDSAHVFPPFGGQGIVSGFRDAMALAWRLQVACQHFPSSYADLFRGWYLERKQQLEQSLAATVANGRYVTEGNPLRVFVRDTSLKLMQMVPYLRRELEKGPRREGLCKYTYQPGLHFIPETGGGKLFPQVYCSSGSGAQEVHFTDDVIFAPQKRGLFQLVAVVPSSNQLDHISEQLNSLDVESHSNGLVSKGETTIIIEVPAADVSIRSGPGYELVRIATAAEFAASPLCEGRPEPKYYDEYRIGKEYPGKQFFLIRPDRFTFAACATIQEMEGALGMVKRVLEGPKNDTNEETQRARL